MSAKLPDLQIAWPPVGVETVQADAAKRALWEEVKKILLQFTSHPELRIAIQAEVKKDADISLNAYLDVQGEPNTDPEEVLPGKSELLDFEVFDRAQEIQELEGVGVDVTMIFSREIQKFKNDVCSLLQTANLRIDQITIATAISRMSAEERAVIAHMLSVSAMQCEDELIDIYKREGGTAETYEVWDEEEVDEEDEVEAEEEGGVILLDDDEDNDEDAPSLQAEYIFGILRKFHAEVVAGTWDGAGGPR